MRVTAIRPTGPSTQTRSPASLFFPLDLLRVGFKNRSATFAGSIEVAVSLCIFLLLAKRFDEQRDRQCQNGDKAERAKAVQKRHHRRLLLDHPVQSSLRLQRSVIGVQSRIDQDRFQPADGLNRRSARYVCVNGKYAQMKL